MNKISVPSSKILQMYNVQLQRINNKIHANDEQFRTPAAIRDALLTKLMSGEIRVNLLATFEFEQNPISNK